MQWKHVFNGFSEKREIFEWDHLTGNPVHCAMPVWRKSEHLHTGSHQQAIKNWGSSGSVVQVVHYQVLESCLIRGLRMFKVILKKSVHRLLSHRMSVSMTVRQIIIVNKGSIFWVVFQGTDRQYFEITVYSVILPSVGWANTASDHHTE